MRISRKLKAALGHPDYGYTSIHVGGTNGKGSVATKIAKGLQLAGNKVGLFTSPHLVSLRERFVVDGHPCSSQVIEKGLVHLFYLCDAHQITPTYFELCAALALHLFAEALVDYAVIEVGMGGRLDATNVIHPALTVITSIGLDHTDFLGESLEEIAREKGGILKPKIPVILGPTAQGLGIEEMAQKLDSPCKLVSGCGEENGAIARAALEELGVPNGEEACQWEPPGRFQEFSINGGRLLVDVAHNPPALIRLFQLLSQTYPHLKRRVIAGFTRGHDLEKMVEICTQEADSLAFAQLKSKRAVLMNAPPFDEVWEEALSQWDPDSELLVLTGSCYIVGEFFESTAGLEMCGDWQSGGGPHTIPLEEALLPS